MSVNQFAPVANLTTYQRLNEVGELGTYHLLIATEVVKDLQGWSQMWSYPNIDPDVGKDMFIIMDNGLIEAGEPADAEVLHAACEAVHPNVVVLPDVLGHYKETEYLVKRDYGKFKSLGYPLMGVLQGRTAEEVVRLLTLYEALALDYISIPRVMTAHFGSRRWLVERVRWIGKPIHLLGWSENVEDDLRCAAMQGVMGIDSAVPIWWTDPMPRTPPTESPFGSRPSNYWTFSPTGDEFKIIRANIKWSRWWINKYADELRTRAVGTF